jgi:hypothetical protein
VQFAYGEDGVDVTSSAYLKQVGFLAENAEGVARCLDLPAALQAPANPALERRARRSLLSVPTPFLLPPPSAAAAAPPLLFPSSSSSAPPTSFFILPQAV